MARVDSTGAYWLLADRLGSIRDVTDNTGVLKDHTDCDGFGNVTAETNSTYGGNYRWAAMRYDAASTLYLTNARPYASSVGRWNAQDPWGLGAGDSNLYRYVFNAPTAATDPSGLLAITPRFLPGGQGGQVSNPFKFGPPQSKNWWNFNLGSVGKLITGQLDAKAFDLSLRIRQSQAKNGLPQSPIYIPGSALFDAGLAFWAGVYQGGVGVGKGAVRGAGRLWNAITHPVDTVVGAAKGAWNLGKNLVTDFPGTVKSIISNTWDQIRDNPQEFFGEFGFWTVLWGVGGRLGKRNCFVAGTPVLVPSEFQAVGEAAALSTSRRRRNLWMAAATAAGLGLAGAYWLERQRQTKELDDLAWNAAPQG